MPACSVTRSIGHEFCYAIDNEKRLRLDHRSDVHRDDRAVLDKAAFLARSVGIGVRLRQKRTVTLSVRASAFGIEAFNPGVGISVSAAWKNQPFTIFI
jgi:hypothetical protein